MASLDDEVPIEIFDVTNGDPKPESSDETVAYDLASWIMQEFGPGFVIIGSPHIGLSDSGIAYPDSIGVIMNHQVGITKSALAEILKSLIDQLERDMNKIENFLNASLGENGYE